MLFTIDILNLLELFPCAGLGAGARNLLKVVKPNLIMKIIKTKEAAISTQYLISATLEPPCAVKLTYSTGQIVYFGTPSPEDAIATIEKIADAMLAEP